MAKIHRLFDVNDLVLEIEAGFVRERRHPQDPSLTIFNYTEKTQYERRWTSVTMQCRGLIVNNVTDEIIAAPWPKFFNLGEHDPNRWVLSTPVVAQDKMDGSLGILYPGPDGWAIATRGSFESDQAIHATEVLRTKYADFEPIPGLTYLFEIIYPGNRIVLDYGDQDDLVLLDVLATDNGRSAYPALVQMGWTGPVVGTLPAKTLGEALDLPDRKNAEGLVITFPSDGMKLKIKQEDYVRLHKIVTGLNERVVWEHLAEHEGRFDQLLMVVPDEFHDWVREVAERLLSQYEEVQGRAHAAYHDLLYDVHDKGGYIHGVDDPREMRKTFALMAAEYADLRPFLFMLLDGRDISTAIWKTLKPKGETASLMNRTEDVA
jgi:RNA ligase